MSVGFLSTYQKQDVELVGGKAANLGELASHGFPVPPGFVICSDEYATAIAALESGVDRETFREVIDASFLSQEVRDGIEQCHQSLQADRSSTLVYAVRSSATAEDLGDASFAGQHGTFYYVTYDDLIPMIKKCWLSLWSDEAMAYRDTQGIEHHKVLMAVVVQEMIRSDISGVTFTANPLTGTTKEIVTDATWGMGAAIVDGRVTPDHYVLLRQDLTISSRKIANKSHMVSTTRMNDGGRMIAVPHHLRQVPCLDDDQIVAVAKWALEAEEHFGAPQDLEWALRDGTYYMLQSRPITTLLDNVDEEPETRKLVLFKPFAENMGLSEFPN